VRTWSGTATTAGGFMGLARALEMQNKQPEAAAARAQFERAWARADIRITSSRI